MLGSKNYWLTTVRADGRPHLMAVWAVWSEGALFFSTDGVKASNLAGDPRCAVATEGAAEPVVLEGSVRLVARGFEWDRVRPEYAVKYGDGFPEGSPLFALRPQMAFGFLEGADVFANSATRWRFSS